MQSDIQINKSLFGALKSYTYSYTLESNPEKSLALFKSCAELVKKIASEPKPLKNIKGLDKYNFVESSEGLAHDQQLFGYKVKFVNPDGIEESDSFYVTTPFDSFAATDIFHKIAKVPGFQLKLDIDSPLNNPELTLESFEFGMDFFGANAFASWVIKSASVVESFYIRLDRDEKIKVSLMSENKPDKLKSSEILSPLISVLKSNFNYDFFEDLSSKLQ